MIDHAGPMTTSIRDNALLLSVLAGYDGFDPRMTPETPLRQNVPQYHEILDKTIAEKTADGTWTTSSAAKGLKVAILKEAWDAPTISEDVINAVKQAGERFRSLGAEVDEVSVPMHTTAPAIWAGATRAQMGEFATAGVAPDLLSFPFAAINPSVPTQEVSESYILSSEVPNAHFGVSKELRPWIPG
jgi:amidase